LTSIGRLSGQLLPVTGLTEHPEAAIGGLPYEIQVIDPHAIDNNAITLSPTELPQQRIDWDLID
jgi:hypothetical protein